MILPVTDGPGILPDVATRLAANNLRVADLALRRPTLDDVFLTLTGQAAAPPAHETRQVRASRPGCGSGEDGMTAAAATAVAPVTARPAAWAGCWPTSPR